MTRPKEYKPLDYIAEDSGKILNQLEIMNRVLIKIGQNLAMLNETIDRVISQIDKFMELDLNEGKNKV